MEPVHLTAADCVFVMIDIQEKLVPALSGGEKAVFEASRLLRCAQEMKIPLLTTEQYPKGLGPTVGPLTRRLTVSPISYLNAGSRRMTK